MQPDKLDSTIDCNINGRAVKVICNIAQMEYQISWHFTTSRERAGEPSGTGPTNRIVNNVGGYRILTNTNQGQTDSSLMIDEFNHDTHSGFYWCTIFNIAFSTPSTIFSSRVVNITAPTPSEALEQCENAEFQFSGTTTRCALGDVTSNTMRIDIVDGVEYTQITTMAPTTPAPTTPAPTTPAPTTPAPTTQAPTVPPSITTEVSATAPTSNVVRTAIIWFSVGAVVLILLVVAIILCSVAIAKC